MSGDIGQVGVLHESVGHIDAETVDTEVDPEPEDVAELGSHLGVVPVEVGLADVEEVEIPLAVVETGPGRPTEDRHPVVRRLAPVGASAAADHVALPRRRTGRISDRLTEPVVTARGVVGHDVNDDLDASGVRLGGESPGVVEGAESGIDVAVVDDVVAAVEQRRRVPGADPDGVDAESLEMIESVDDAVDVAGAVAVRVGEGAGIHLIDDAVAPPGLGGGCWGGLLGRHGASG